MRKNISTINHKLSTNKGFTLMEVLISSSIFAVIMVMTTGVLAQASAYQTRLKATRETSDEVKRLADMITRDVRTANYTTNFEVAPNNVLPPVAYSFKNGLAFLKFNPTGSPWWWETRYNTAPDTGSSLDANILIIANKENYMVYGSSWENKRVCYAKFPITTDKATINGYLNTIGTCGDYSSSYPLEPEYQITSLKTDATLKFGGFLPDDNFIKDNPTSNQQPYVVFDILSETKDYEGQRVNSRSQSRIRSAVTGRHFND